MKRTVVILALFLLPCFFVAPRAALSSTDGSLLLDTGTLFSQPNPSRGEIERVLKEAEEISPQQVAEIGARLKGRKIQWRGFVHKIKGHDGNIWVLVCVLCENGSAAGYDTLFTLIDPYAVVLREREEIYFTGIISHIEDASKMDVLGDTGSGYKVFLENAWFELRPDMR